MNRSPASIASVCVMDAIAEIPKMMPSVTGTQCSNVMTCDETSKVYRTMQQSAVSLKFVSSKMCGRVSIHLMPTTTSCGSIFAFHEKARQISYGPKSFIGTLNGDIVLSINTAHSPGEDSSSKKNKKRVRDTSEEDAHRAVAKVERCGGEASMVSEYTFKAARETLKSMLDTRGVGGEAVIESWAVSLRSKGSWGSSQNNGGVPSIVIAFRFAAGVAIPLAKLCEALNVCKDGLVTVSSDSLSPDFDLPLSDQGNASEGSGQKSMILIASVPHITA